MKFNDTLELSHSKILFNSCKSNFTTAAFLGSGFFFLTEKLFLLICCSFPLAGIQQHFVECLFSNHTSVIRTQTRKAVQWRFHKRERMKNLKPWIFIFHKFSQHNICARKVTIPSHTLVPLKSFSIEISWFWIVCVGGEVMGSWMKVSR